ncbi:hypothetical protein SAMN05444340_108119 [Citreimonas salinaria]|uniref:SnoaL-like domain-containing protein n=2 Tax=Citreimonas salinaria TaxID=321339 RepID=A0A1H3K3R1_9RHOB|nr:hypothetical protein SAMN05444340_108119 [Citreimonas salinaria]
MTPCFGPAGLSARGTGAGTASEFDVAQHNLDHVSAAVLAGDFDAFLNHVRLPLVTATARGLQRFETRASLQAAFRRMAEAARTLKVTRVDSTVEAVVEDGRGRLLRAHVTRLWSGDTLARAPHSGLSVIEQDDGHWRLSRAQFALADDATAGMGFEMAPGADEDHAEVAAIFSHALDRMTQAFLEGDFDLLCDTTRHPLFLQNTEGTHIVRTRDTLRAQFDRVLADFRMNEITDMVRLVKRARRLGDRRVQGLYRTHVLSGQMLALPSFISVMTIEQGDDRVWRTVEIMHPLGPMTLARKLAAM